MIFPRERYLQKIISRKHNGLIKVITGMRRAGKSFLMNELFLQHLLQDGVPGNRIVRFAFDSDEDLDLLEQFFPEEPVRKEIGKGQFVVNSKKFRAYIREKAQGTGQYYFLLDEVQLLEGFTGTLNSLLRHRNYDIYVTGSNSRFLSSDIATEFKGRGTVIHVLPLTFGEYCYGLQRAPQDAWKDYLETGGIPLVALMHSREERMDYLKNLCEETYLKDIIQHHQIRKSTELGEILNVICSSVGSPVNPLKIANTFMSLSGKRITDDTAAAFIDYFIDSFLISGAQRYDIRGRKYIGALYKLYAEDIGIRNARLNFRQIEETHLMENVLYNELRYRGYNVDVGEIAIREKTDRLDRNGKNVYSQKSLEVDFVATCGNSKYYFQSTLSMTDPEKAEQEKKSFYSIDDSFQKIIITRNGLHPQTDEKGILIVDLFDFLLNSDICAPVVL